MEREKRILVVFGTRPEVIKLAPVVRALREHGGARVLTCSTGQHRQMLDEALAAFDLGTDFDLELMREDQRLSELFGRLMLALPGIVDQVRPDVLVVQGDTMTVMGAALCGFLEGCQVAHVEAGLRTRDKRVPFPEELSRRVTGRVADLHFAPTEAARRSLLAEGVEAERVWVTGNTGVDASLWMRDELRRRGVGPPIQSQRRLVLVTAHRRESFGDSFRELCGALRELIETFADIEIVYPVHLNPNVQLPVRELLTGLPRMHLIDPLPYAELTAQLLASELVLTDSGGIQEEAPTLGVPVLVLREETERPEAVQAGLAKLVGTDRALIVREASRLLTDQSARAKMARACPLYGDGLASRRIAEQIISAQMSTPPFRCPL